MISVCSSCADLCSINAPVYLGEGSSRCLITLVKREKRLQSGKLNFKVYLRSMAPDVGLHARALK